MLSLLLSLALAAPAPQLFYLDKPAKGPCAARVRDVTKPVAQTWFEAPECPSHVLYNAGKKRVVYAASGRVWMIALDDPSAKPTNLGPLPPHDVEDLWIEEGSRQVRASVLVRISDEDVIENGGKRAVRFEKKEHSLEGVPPWGTPFMALLLELDGKGAWKRIAATPTTWEAGDTLGVAVLDRLIKPASDVVRLTALLRAQTCHGGALDCELSDAAIKKNVQKLLGPSDDGYGVLKSGQSVLLAFAVGVGDTPHAVPPVFVCKDGCASGTRVAVTVGQLGLAERGGFALVTEEYSGNAPIVVDSTGKVVLSVPHATRAVWLP